MTVRMQADQGVFYWVPNEESGKAPGRAKGHSQSFYESEDVTTSRSSKRRVGYADLQFDEVRAPQRRTPRKKPTQKTKVHVLKDGSSSEERVIVIDKRSRKEDPMIDSRRYDDGYRDSRPRYRDDDDYVEVRRPSRRPAPRYEERYEEYSETRTRKATKRERLIEMAEEEGPGTYKVNGEEWVVRRRNGDWDVRRAEDVQDEPDEGRIERVSSKRSKGSSEETEPGKKRSLLGRIARIASWGFLGVGAAYFLGGVGGIVTNGASIPVYAPGGLPGNVEQAIPALVGGGVFAALGFTGLRATKKK
jgi:hypothetical protein